MPNGLSDAEVSRLNVDSAVYTYKAEKTAANVLSGGNKGVLSTLSLAHSGLQTWIQSAKDNGLNESDIKQMLSKKGWLTPSGGDYKINATHLPEIQKGLQERSNRILLTQRLRLQPTKEGFTIKPTIESLKPPAERQVGGIEAFRQGAQVPTFGLPIEPGVMKQHPFLSRAGEVAGTLGTLATGGLSLPAFVALQGGSGLAGRYAEGKILRGETTGQAVWEGTKTGTFQAAEAYLGSKLFQKIGGVTVGRYLEKKKFAKDVLPGSGEFDRLTADFDAQARNADIATRTFKKTQGEFKTLPREQLPSEQLLKTVKESQSNVQAKAAAIQQSIDSTMDALDQANAPIRKHIANYYSKELQGAIDRSMARVKYFSEEANRLQQEKGRQFSGEGTPSSHSTANTIDPLGRAQELDKAAQRLQQQVLLEKHVQEHLIGESQRIQKNIIHPSQADTLVTTDKIKFASDEPIIAGRHLLRNYEGQIQELSQRQGVTPYNSPEFNALDEQIGSLMRKRDQLLPLVAKEGRLRKESLGEDYFRVRSELEDVNGQLNQLRKASSGVRATTPTVSGQKLRDLLGRKKILEISLSDKERELGYKPIENSMDIAGVKTSMPSIKTNKIFQQAAKEAQSRISSEPPVAIKQDAVSTKSLAEKVKKALNVSEGIDCIGGGDL